MPSRPWSVTGGSEGPGTPTARPLVERVCRPRVCRWVIELLIVRDADVGEPALVDVPVHLEDAVAAEGAATGIIMLMSWVPALIAFVAAGVMSFYPLNKQKMYLITQDLTARRVGS